MNNFRTQYFGQFYFGKSQVSVKINKIKMECWNDGILGRHKKIRQLLFPAIHYSIFPIKYFKHIIWGMVFPKHKYY